MNTAKIAALRIGAAATLVVLVVLPPVGIATLVGRPYPDWTTLRDQIDVGRVSTDTVMRIAAALFIGIWVWIVATIAGEIFRIINAHRNIPPSSPMRGLPEPVGSSGALRRLVRLAVLGTVTTAATVSTWSSATVATAPTLSMLTTTDRPISAPADPADSMPAEPSTTTIIANGRSTPLSLAVDLGDENLRDDIVAMNRTSEWTSGVFPAGMLITVPLVEPTTNPTTTPATPDSTPSYYVVEDNDGLWNVAEAFLGDGSRHHELRELLFGQQVAPGVIFTANTDVIHPGWVFERPTDASAATGDVVTVQHGDTLSRIAADHLGDADRWTEIWERNANTTMPDGRTFDDPNLIVPGWQLRLAEPTPDRPDTPPLDQAASTSPPDEPVEKADTPDVVVPRSSAEPAGPTPDLSDTPSLDQPASASAPDESVEEANQLDIAVPRSSAEPADPTPTNASPIKHTSNIDPVDRNLPPQQPAPEPAVAAAESAAEATSLWSTAERSVWPKLTVGALLVAGLAETIRRLRNRRLSQLAPSQRLQAPPDVASGTEHAIIQANTGAPIRSTIHGLLRSLTPYAAEQTDPPSVRAVQIGSERIEVLFSKPAPMPPTGWSTIDGGHSWTHRLDEPPNHSRQLLTPALVTIGVRYDDNANEVLLDLETAGSLCIAGDREASLGLARSIALELATYPLDVSMDVCLIGLHVVGTELCDRVWLDTTMTRAVRVTRQRLEQSAIQDATNIVAARAGLDEDDGAHDPQVFVIDLENLDDDDSALADELVRLCQSSTGTVAVLVGDREDTGEHISTNSDGTAHWSGVDLRTPNVTHQAASEVAVMLDHVANAPSEPIKPDELMVATLKPVETSGDQATELDADSVEAAFDDGDESVEAFHYQPPAHDLVIQVMGNVQTHGADLTADETELLALLTCLRHRTEIHIGLVHESIAPERAKKTLANRMSRLRGQLGAGSDGRDLLPEASTGRNGRSHYLVSPLVVTDVDLLEHRYHTADTLGSTDALTVMRDGLELMEGPLFRARKGFDAWPHSEGVVVAMTAVVQSYATRLIELAIDIDDIPLVLRTTATAGRVLDNPLSEFPMRQAEHAYAEACGNTELLASVEGARRRLIEYIDADDAFADM